MKFNNTLLTYLSSTNNSVINNGGTLSLAETPMFPGQRKYFTAKFTVATTAPLGDTIVTTATALANTSLATYSAQNTISGSYDPNDKAATPSLTPQQVLAGKYINYTIRFQNTGTDTAFNIVITDTLSNLLQAGTLEILNTSYPCNVTVKDNRVAFEFLNILLPDSNINEAASHGFVTFRIKPQPTAAGNGTIINNKAAIYFDYNAAVITNTAITNIKEPFITVPLKLIAFTALNEKDNKAILYWNSVNEINTSYFVIQQSIDGTHFKDIATVRAKGNDNNTYMQLIDNPVSDIVYYRLKIIGADNLYSYSAILTLKNSNTRENISILTNPAKDAITIKVANASFNRTEARIISMQGITVRKLILQQGITTLDVSNLSTGNYYLQTKAGSKKIIISR